MGTILAGRKRINLPTQLFFPPPTPPAFQQAAPVGPPKQWAKAPSRSGNPSLFYGDRGQDPLSWMPFPSQRGFALCEIIPGAAGASRKQELAFGQGWQMSPAQPLVSRFILVLQIGFPCKTCGSVPADPAGGFSRLQDIAAPTSPLQLECVPAWCGAVCACANSIFSLSFSLLSSPFCSPPPGQPNPAFLQPSPLFTMDSKGWG